MSKFLASVFILVAAIANALGNFWFVYGIWPRSWSAFCFFGVTSVIIMALAQVVREDK